MNIGARGLRWSSSFCDAAWNLRWGCENACRPDSWRSLWLRLWCRRQAVLSQPRFCLCWLAPAAPYQCHLAVSCNTVSTILRTLDQVWQVEAGLNSLNQLKSALPQSCNCGSHWQACMLVAWAFMRCLLLLFSSQKGVQRVQICATTNMYTMSRGSHMVDACKAVRSLQIRAGHVSLSQVESVLGAASTEASRSWAASLGSQLEPVGASLLWQLAETDSVI